MTEQEWRRVVLNFRVRQGIAFAGRVIAAAEMLHACWNMLFGWHWALALINVTCAAAAFFGAAYLDEAPLVRVIDPPTD